MTTGMRKLIDAVRSSDDGHFSSDDYRTIKSAHKLVELGLVTLTIYPNSYETVYDWNGNRMYNDRCIRGGWAIKLVEGEPLTGPVERTQGPPNNSGRCSVTFARTSCDR